MKENGTLQVLYDGKVVGNLALMAGRKIAFEYSEEWLETGFSISPFSLPLKEQVFIPTKEYFGGLFGVFGDSLPDGWGNLLLNRMLRKKGMKPEEMTMLNRLAIVGQYGMGALTYRPEEHFSFEPQGYDLDDLALQCQKILNTEYDLIILDIMMPGMDGYQTCRKMREESNAPILFLSARTKDSDKTLGFSSGGDDYLAKPFSYNELISRAKALIRRYQVYKGKAEKVETPKNFSCKNLVVDEETKSVYSDGQLLELTDTEYAILLLLLKNRRQVFSTERLYEAVWKENFYYGAENTVMVHIRNLRRKVERDSKNPMIIKTSWGKGYYCD